MFGGEQAGGVGGKLAQLGPSVFDALQQGLTADTAKNSVDKQQVINSMSGISGQPLAGMNQYLLA